GDRNVFFAEFGNDNQWKMPLGEVSEVQGTWLKHSGPKAPPWRWRRPAVFPRVPWPEWGTRVLINTAGMVGSRGISLGIAIFAVEEVTPPKPDPKALVGTNKKKKAAAAPPPESLPPARVAKMWEGGLFINTTLASSTGTAAAAGSSSSSSSSSTKESHHGSFVVASGAGDRSGAASARSSVTGLDLHARDKRCGSSSQLKLPPAHQFGMKSSLVALADFSNTSNNQPPVHNASTGGMANLAVCKDLGLAKKNILIASDQLVATALLSNRSGHYVNSMFEDLIGGSGSDGDVRDLRWGESDGDASPAKTERESVLSMPLGSSGATGSVQGGGATPAGLNTSGFASTTLPLPPAGSGGGATPSSGVMV
ncbi:unnamed protein product, partial [Amoebophrya sp. A25]